MPVISERHGYLFILNPRTGSTAISEGVLIPHLDGRRIPERHLHDDKGRLLMDAKHGTIRQLVDNDLLRWRDVDRLFTFVTVRNPFDSIVSLFERSRTLYVANIDNPDHYMHRNPRAVKLALAARDEGFDAWMRMRFGKEAAERPPRHLHGPLLEGIDFIMRFERLQEDFDRAMGHIGLDPIEIPKINVTGRDPRYRDHYSDESRSLVETVFALDLERFGYRF